MNAVVLCCCGCCVVLWYRLRSTNDRRRTRAPPGWFFFFCRNPLCTSRKKRQLETLEISIREKICAEADLARDASLFTRRGPGADFNHALLVLRPAHDAHNASPRPGPTMFALTITSAAAARVAPAPTSAPDRRARVATRASSPDLAESRAAGVPAAGHAVTRRGALFGAAAAALALGAPSPALAKRANKLADLSSLSPRSRSTRTPRSASSRKPPRWWRAPTGRSTSRVGSPHPRRGRASRPPCTPPSPRASPS